MRTRIIISLIVLAAFMILSQPSMADDLADLKAAHEGLVNAWNKGDLDTFFDIWQDGGIWIPTSQAFPIVTNSALGKQMFSKWLETHFSRETWYKADYRVIGDVGLVWGVRTSIAIVKATGTGKRVFEKESLVFVKSEGKWRAAMSHSTPIPSEVDIY